MFKKISQTKMFDGSCHPAFYYPTLTVSMTTLLAEHLNSKPGFIATDLASLEIWPDWA